MIKNRLIVFALMLTMVLLGCEQQLQDSTKNNTRSASTKDETWPPGLKDGEVISLESNDLLRRNFYVVLDGSGSMAKSDCAGGKQKFEAAVSALSKFTQSAPADANIGLLIFDADGVSERVPLGVGNRNQLVSVLKKAQPEGGTPLHTAIALGVDALTIQASKQLGYGEYNLLVVTDGEASPGEDPTKIVDLTIDYTPIVIQTIGFCIDENHSLNQPGRTIYTAVDNVEKLNRELQNILVEAQTFDLTDFQQ